MYLTQTHISPPKIVTQLPKPNKDLSHVTPNSSRINKNSARYLSANTHDSASRVTSNHSRINENLAPYVKINTHNSALYFAHDHSRISEILVRH